MGTSKNNLPPSYQPTKPASNKQQHSPRSLRPLLFARSLPLLAQRHAGGLHSLCHNFASTIASGALDRWEQMHGYTALSAPPLRFAPCRGFVRFAHFRTPAPRSPPRVRGQFVASLPPAPCGVGSRPCASLRSLGLRFARGGRASGVSVHLL